jgi:NAD kinase
MNRLSERKIVLVIRETRLANLKARFATKMQARFYVNRLGGDFGDYEEEDATYRAAIENARQSLADVGRVQVVDRKLLPNFVFGPEDIVVALGQDGLVANTLKYLAAHPLIGVNPDPARWDGKLLPFRVKDLAKVAAETIAGRRRTRRVDMAEAALNTGTSLFAVNDFFIGVRGHASARYRIEADGRAENQSSSGIIVSTGLGSTGWYRSLITGATAIAGVKPPPTDFAWDSGELRYTVREPFPSRTTGTTIVAGKIKRSTPLGIESQMSESGVIFSDGIESDFLEFNSGTRAIVSLAQRQGALVA